MGDLTIGPHRATSRLTASAARAVATALMLGLFLMHGALAMPGGCHQTMATTVAPALGMAAHHDTLRAAAGATQHVRNDAPNAGMPLVSWHGTTCVSRAEQHSRNIAPALAILHATGVAPTAGRRSFAALPIPARHSPPSGRELLHRLQVLRT